jgi:2-C-methyl-D-erythritol 4-phosphate cytidylyltransferase
VLPATAHIAKFSGNILDISVDSAALSEIQSPQIFSRELLTDAYAKRANLAGQKPVDDAALVRLAGGKVTTIPGSPFNVRLATDEWVRIGGDYLKHLPKPRKSSPMSPFDEAQW